MTAVLRRAESRGKKHVVTLVRSEDCLSFAVCMTVNGEGQWSAVRYTQVVADAEFDRVVRDTAEYDNIRLIEQPLMKG